jgi:hypothetical protein
LPQPGRMRIVTTRKIPDEIALRFMHYIGQIPNV